MERRGVEPLKPARRMRSGEIQVKKPPLNRAKAVKAYEVRKLGKWKATTGPKYSNKITAVEGKSFHSKLEADRYQELLLLGKAGEITDLLTQETFRLELPHPKTGTRHLICKYIADFVYVDARGNQVVEDTKGVITDLFRLKARLMLCIHGIEVKILTRKDVGRFS